MHGTKHGLVADATTDEIAVVAQTDAGLGVFVAPGAQAVLTPVHSLDLSMRPLCTAVFDGTPVVQADRMLAWSRAARGRGRG